MRAVMLLALVSYTLCLSTSKVQNAANKINNFKQKVINHDDTVSDSGEMVSSGKIFGYGRKEGKTSIGQVIAKVSKSPIMVDLTPDDQQRRWYDLHDKKFPLKASGFSQWRPTRTGIIFRTEDEKSTKVCQSSKHTGSNSTAVFHFNCDPATKASPRFAESRSSRSHSRYYYYWAPVTDGTPYGWNGYWDNWTYAYWAVGPRGYYGCNSLVAQDWCPDDYPNCACGDKVAYYPFTNCGDSDCLPVTGSQYSNYYLPYCSSCQYVTPDYYSPGCPDCPYTTVSYDYTLVQKSNVIL